MRSEAARRAPQLGFTLLETMLAIAMLGLVLAGTYSIALNGFRQQGAAMRDDELAAFARAVLDEYRVTWPDFPASGSYKGIWEWQIAEAPQALLEPTSLDSYFDFRNVTATVRRLEPADSPSFSLSTVIARRATE